MKKIYFIMALTCGVILPCVAEHIKGGEIFYSYVGPGAQPNTDRYVVTLRLFITCASSGGQLDSYVNIGIFRNSDNGKAPGSPFSFTLTGDEFINLTSPSPCILNPSPVCYRVRVYSREVTLPREAQGYTAVFQRCCRINGIENLSPSQQVGSTYSCRIHGVDDIPAGQNNSSPQFLVKDTVLICQNRRFELNFGAIDSDGDSLSYEFCNAYASPSNPPVVTDPAPPSSLSFVSYAAGFSGSQPLGSSVTINPKTGLISGIAPRGGDYVVCVCLKEWRNGKVISEHRKDFNIKIDERCDLAAAELEPGYITCDGFDFTFQNEAPHSPLIKSWYWDFGVANRTNDTSTLEKPTFVFPDTGVYIVKLIINRGDECSDSAITQVKVYPGFFAGFSVAGSCKLIPFQFTDTTRTNYGVVSKWRWNFDDETSSTDTSRLKNPTWKYNSTGFKRVEMIVESSKGCIDTIYHDLEVRDKPLITFPFRDTLICSIDSLQLGASGLGVFSWSPQVNIINSNSANPIVYPKSTMHYKATLNDNGCMNTDSVLVRVVDYVSLFAGQDTVTCETDTIRLRPASNGLRYSWSPSTALSDPKQKSPLCFASNTTRYVVEARIGKCVAQDDIVITTVPYPIARAGADTVICYDDTAMLRASVVASRYNWTPAATLSNSSILNPLAFPRRSTIYTLMAYDTLGCPKAGIDQVTLTVRPKIDAFAGNDTSIVVGQPLNLHASGAEFFEWSPPFNLSNPDVPNPVAHLQENATYLMKAYTEEGCFAYDTINIKVFKTGPDIFMPNAFVPSGRNSILRPILVGVSKLNFFRVYNRWGQLVFTTNVIGKGWNGTVNGKPQDSGTYVWMVSGVDFTGKVVTRRGTAVLIR